MVTLIKRGALVVALTLVAAAVACADATGKWSWTSQIQGNDVKQTLELKQDGEKLTGTLTGRNNQKIEIKDGKVKGQELSFVVVRERDGQEFKINYKGKLEGDTIKGNITLNIQGQDQTREWVAKREK